MDVAASVEARRSVRGFRPDPVPPEVLTRIFERAARAPSWCNIQPWRAWVASGPARDALVAKLLAAAAHGAPHPDVPFPADYPEPYATHRRACGRALYDAIGVERHDAEGRQRAWLRNFEAFGAPHVALVGIDRRFGEYGALDLGCWLSTVMLLATSEGVATCAQASLALYPNVAREALGIPEGIKLLFGIALGYEDAAEPANGCRTTRDSLDASVTFVGG
jgi:nitroreductase